MKRRVVFFAVVTCIVGVLLLKHGATSDPRAADQGTDQAEGHKIESPAADPATTGPGAFPADASQRDSHAYFSPITGGKPRARAPMDPFVRVPRTRVGMPLENDQFVADSVEEQRWLDRNGYPNTEQWAAYAAAPDVTLEAAAAHGDSVADVMLAARQLAQGDPEAAGKLMTAGANGSSFALSMLASYLANGKNGNPELAYAVSRVVELRGDWRAGITRDAMFRSPLSAEQRLRAEGTAFKLLEDLDKNSSLPNYVDPRPLPPRSRG